MDKNKGNSVTESAPVFQIPTHFPSDFFFKRNTAR